MRMTLMALAAAMIAAVSGAGPALAQPEPPPGAPPVPIEGEEAATRATVHQDDAGRLVAFARRLREGKGCAAAAPAYRVIAGMGEGQEAAQHELGECLLDIDGATPTETLLFRQEGEFWLTRAAFAGNARAQRRLLTEMASPASALHDPKSALHWALVYDENPTAALYGYKALPATLVTGLKASLSASDIADAEAFAAAFAPLYLAKFEGPKAEKGKLPKASSRERPRRPGIGGAR